MQTLNRKKPPSGNLIIESHASKRQRIVTMLEDCIERFIGSCRKKNIL